MAIKLRAPSRGTPFEAELSKAKRESAIQLLFRASRRLNERALALASARLKVALRPSHTNLLPHVDLSGTRQSELARRLGVSKQAVHQLVSEMSELGLLERVPDPADGRAALVRFTEAGKRSLLVGLGILRELEAEMAATLGSGQMRSLHRALLQLDDWLDAAERSGLPPGPDSR